MGPVEQLFFTYFKNDENNNKNETIILLFLVLYSLNNLILR